MRQLLVWIQHELGGGRATANARTELDEMERTLAAVDALGARLAARAAVQRAA